MFLHADSKTQAVQSVRWTHRSLCWFCRAAAHFKVRNCLIFSNSPVYRKETSLEKML